MFSECKGLLVNFMLEKNGYQHISLGYCKKNQKFSIQHSASKLLIMISLDSIGPTGLQARLWENRFISVQYVDRLQSAIESKSNGLATRGVLLRAITCLTQSNHTVKIIDMKSDDQSPPYITNIYCFCCIGIGECRHYELHTARQWRL